MERQRQGNKFLYAYYFILVVIIASYQEFYSPNIAIRLLFLMALAVPTLSKNNITLLPAIMTVFLSLSRYTFAFPIPPTQLSYYVLIALIGYIVAKGQVNLSQKKVNNLFLFLFLFITFDNLIQKFSIEDISLSILIFIFLYYCCSEDDESSIKYMEYGFILITLVICYWSLFCIAAQINVYNAAGGMEQTGWTDPNYLGCIMGMGFIVALKILLERGHKFSLKIFLIFTLILSFVALILNASRGAILAVGTASIFTTILSHIKFKTKLFFILCIIAFIVILYNNDIFNLLIARVENDDGSGSGRLGIWDRKWTAFITESNIFHWIIGYGLAKGLALGATDLGGITGFHNDYLASIVEYGVMGFILFVVVLLYPLKNSLKQNRKITFSLLVYLATCCLTLEPFTAGSFPFFAFYFYITLLAKSTNKMDFKE